MPQRAPGAGIERESIVGRSDVHDSADHHRRRFQHLRVAGMENPGGAELVDIRNRDLVQTAVATSGVVAIIGSPVFTGWLGLKIFALYVDYGGE